MGTIYQVVVHGVKGEKMPVDLCNTEEQLMKMTLLQLKEKITKKLPETAEVEALRLIFENKMLDGNDKLLTHLGIEHMSVIQVVIRVRGGLNA
ncbi:uncharacterized protein ACO6RY_03302 [Pungitius sinensis]